MWQFETHTGTKIWSLTEWGGDGEPGTMERDLAGFLVDVRLELDLKWCVSSGYHSLQILRYTLGISNSSKLKESGLLQRMRDICPLNLGLGWQTRVHWPHNQLSFLNNDTPLQALCQLLGPDLFSMPAMCLLIGPHLVQMDFLLYLAPSSQPLPFQTAAPDSWRRV